MYPLKERTEFNSGLINLFVAICDCEEEKGFDTVCPEGIPRHKPLIYLERGEISFTFRQVLFSW